MKNNLEDQLKDAFGNFEPEVDASLWTKISSQLPAAPTPVQPANIPSGPLASLSSAGSWIAGTVAVAIVGAGAFIALRQSPADKATVLTPPATAITTESAETAQEHPESTKDISSAPQPISTIETAAEKATHETPAAVTSSNSQPIDTRSEPVQSSALTTTPASNPVPVIPKNEAAVQPAPQSVAETETAVTTPLRLIVNTSGGFAPLAITALSNQPGKKANFEFGDGYSVSGESATHTYREAGVYRIQCTSGDQQNELEVEVLEALPTAFSPNGDGANDSYTVSNPDIREIELRIYTRSGRQVYSGKGETVSWNGQLPDSRLAETGTYFYDIFVTSARGNSYKQKGTLTLFR